MRRFVISVLMCGVMVGLSESVCFAAAFGTGSSTVAPPPSGNGYRYLLGREISLKGTKLITTVGTYDIGSVPDVENRVMSDGADGTSKQRPHVELVFQGAQLIKVVIY